MNKTEVLYPQRRMVAYHRANAERYLRMAAIATRYNNIKLRDLALDQAAYYDGLATDEERDILRSRS